MQSLFKYYNTSDNQERCGLILSGGETLESKNIHPEPEKGFEIDPEDILKHIDELAGTWHTHPNTSSVLSAEDFNCFKQWPDLTHYIISGDGIRVYKVIRGAVVDVNYITWPNW